jgi:hypothetical protein
MKRRRVNDRTAVPLAVVAGLIAVTSGASPTGTAWSDLVLVVGSVALVTWAGASTPWWTGAALAGLAAAIAGDVALTVIGLAAFVSGLGIGLARRDVPLARAAVVGVALNVLIRSNLEGFLGLSAVIGVVAGAIVLVIGVTRRRSRVQHVVWVGLAVFVLIGVVGVASATVAGLMVRSDLTAGNRQARTAIDQLGDGDYVAAARGFDDAAASFASADATLGAPWARPAQLVPGLAQNLTTTRDLTSAVAGVSADLGTALGAVDPEQLRLVNGRIDVDAVRLVQQPFRDVQQSIADLDQAIDDADSPWLVSPLVARLDDLDEEIADNQQRLDNAVLAVELAPQLLGADGERRYFIAFTTPAEARGLGGFMGNWAELTVADGRFSISDSGRTSDLNNAGVEGRAVSGPTDWVEQWGGFGFTNGPGGGAGAVPWSNVTISPHFPSTAQVIAELYPQSGGGELDGVFAMDPFVLQALLGLTGPVSIPGATGQLSQANVVDFLLVEQYLIDDEEARVDLLEEVSRATIVKVLGGDLPSPATVARELGPLAAQGRLAGWVRDPVEQQLFERVHLAAALPDRSGDASPDGGPAAAGVAGPTTDPTAMPATDGYAVVINNSGANKLDTYLARDVVYEIEVDPATGAAEGTLTVTFTNSAPADRLPDSVAGNYTGDDRGTNRALVTVYTALPVTEATVSARAGSEPVTLTPGIEAGWNTATTLVAIPPGQPVTLTIRVQGTLDLASPYSLAVRPHPLVQPEVHRIAVRTRDGRELVAYEGPMTTTRRFGGATGP